MINELASDAEEDLAVWEDAGIQIDDPQPPDTADPAAQVWADRRLYVLARCQAEADSVQAVAKSRRLDISRWEQERLEALQGTIEFLERQLEQWARAMAAANPKAKTWNLPAGKLTLRAGRTLVDVDGRQDMDESQVAVDLGNRRLGGLVRRKVTHALDRQEIAALTAPGAPVKNYPETPGFTAHHAVVKTTGEVVPGIVLLVPDAPTFKATPTSAQPSDT